MSRVLELYQSRWSVLTVAVLIRSRSHGTDLYVRGEQELENTRLVGTFNIARGKGYLEERGEPTLISSKPVFSYTNTKLFQLYYLKVEDPNHRPTKEEIMKDETSILHTLSSVSVEDSLNVQADKYYWVFLAAEIVPDGCPDIMTPSVQLHATKKPPAPEISVDIYGLKERQAFGKEMDYLVDKRDR